MSYENFDPKDLLIQSFPTQPSGFVHRIPNGIRVIHLPTGTVVTCDADRSQHRNRHLALTQLWEQVQGKPTYQELAAQVEALRREIQSAADWFSAYWPELNKAQCDRIKQMDSVAKTTPQQHLRELRAEAGRNGFIAGVEARRIALLNDEQAKIKADQYAERVKAGE